MATQVTKEDTVTTQEGTVLTVKPLTIRSLRKFMTVIEKLNELQREADEAEREYEEELRKYNEAVAEGEDVERPEPPKQDEFAAIDIMVEAAVIALEKYNPDFVQDRERIEDELDMKVLNDILEKSGGIRLDDPNQLTAPTQKKQ